MTPEEESGMRPGLVPTAALGGHVAQKCTSDKVIVCICDCAMSGSIECKACQYYTSWSANMCDHYKVFLAAHRKHGHDLERY